MKTVHGSRFTVHGLIAVIIIISMLTGCGISMLTTVITDPMGEVWTVESKDDARVVITREHGTEKTIVEVDNKGKMHWLEGLMQYILSKPEVTLSNKEGR